MLRIFCVSTRTVKVDFSLSFKELPSVVSDVEYVSLLCNGWICSSRTKPAGNPSLPDRSVCRIKKGKDFYCGRDIKQEDLTHFI